MLKQNNRKHPIPLPVFSRKIKTEKNNNKKTHNCIKTFSSSFPLIFKRILSYAMISTLKREVGCSASQRELGGAASKSKLK